MCGRFTLRQLPDEWVRQLAFPEFSPHVDPYLSGPYHQGCWMASLAEVDQMLRWALVFLVIALVAALFGFGGIAADAAWIAKILFVVFLILFVVSLVMGRRRPGV